MEENYDEDDLSLLDSQSGRVSSSPRDSSLPSAGGSSTAGSSSRPSPRTNGSDASGLAALVPGSFRTFVFSSALCELVATFFLTFIGLSAVFTANLVGDDALSTGSLGMIGMGYGFAYGSLVYCFSLNGGGYIPSIRQMNPALTLALYLLGKMDAVKSGILVAAQIVGAILGTGFIFLCFGGHSLRVFELYDGTNIGQQLMMSTIVTFLVLFVIIITNFGVIQPVLRQGVSTDSSEQSPQSVHELNSLISSFVSMIGVAVGTPITGCFMNPLFALNVLAVTHWYNSAAVVIFGPIAGALLAALAAKLFTYRTRAPFLTGVRWNQGGMGGLGLSATSPAPLTATNPNGQPMSAFGGSTRANPFNPVATQEEKQGSRF